MHTWRSMAYISHVFFRLLAMLTLSALVSMAFNTHASAQQALNVELSPVKSNLVLDPGTTTLQKIRVRNNTDVEQTFFFDAEDFTVGDSEGNVSFLDAESTEQNNFSLKSWLRFEGESIVVPAQDEVEFNVFIEVPIDAEPGGHYAAAFIQTERPDISADQSSSISTVGRIGSLLLVEVPGEQTRKLDVANFEATHRSDGQSSVIINTQTTVQNNGNVHIVPSGSIRVNGRGVDQLIEFNDGRSAVLPNTPDRVFANEIAIESNNLIPLFGRYSVTLEMIYDSGESIVAEQTITIVPYRQLLFMAALGGLTVFVVWRVILSFRRPSKSITSK